MNFLNFLSYGVTVYTESMLGNVPMEGVAGFVQKIIETLSFGGYTAVGILLFSLILKIIPLPLDIYSRAATKKNNLKMEKMRPELERLQKQYANNKELYSQKLMALYKKEGYSQMAACLPSIFTLVFFIIVITAFNQYSTYTKVDIFNEMARAYSQSVITNEYVTYNEEKNQYECPWEEGSEEFNINIRKPAQDAAADKYFEIEEQYSFLWVKNIWIEDLPWKKAFISRDIYVESFKYSKGCGIKDIDNTEINNVEVYDIICGSEKLNEVKNKPNGYLILVVISILSMLVSQLIMSKSQKAQMELQSVDGMNGQAAQTSKMMMWMMPIMFGIFAFMYTASFSIYLIVSTVFSTLSTTLINFIVEKRFEKKIKKEEEEKYQKRYAHLNKK